MRRQWDRILTESFLRIRYEERGLNSSEIAKELDCQPSVILRYLHKRGIRVKSASEARRPYPVNHDYFKNKTHNSFYIIGYTTADGCISNRCGKRILRYSISDKDDGILKFIRDEISPQHPLCYTKQEVKTGKICGLCNLSISSETIADDLLLYSISENKTGNEKLPVIQSEYRADYFRGLFDGDGCISIRSDLPRSAVFVVTSASESFLSDVQRELGMGYGRIHKDSRGSGCYGWRITNKDHIFDLYDFMYNDGYHLVRKKLIFEQLRINNGLQPN